MKIFTLTAKINYEDSKILKCFASIDLAKEYVENLFKENEVEFNSEFVEDEGYWYYDSSMLTSILKSGSDTIVADVFEIKEFELIEKGKLS